jgi:nucleoid DNA-binding protein
MYITMGDLIKRVQKDFPQLKNEVVKVAVEVIFEEMSNIIERGDKLLLTRFGLLYVKKRKNSPSNFKEYKGEIKDTYTKAIIFKFSNKLKRKVNDAI